MVPLFSMAPPRLGDVLKLNTVSIIVPISCVSPLKMAPPLLVVVLLFLNVE
jgi:hypothetical protein